MTRFECKHLFISIFILMLAACGGGSSSGSDNSNNPDNGSPSNTTPTVDAGVDQSVVSGDVVTLSATVTDDDTPTTTWSQVSGTSVSLSTTSAASTEFTAPAVNGSDTLEFEITVDDGTNAAVTDTVVITVLETAPELPAAFLWFNGNVEVTLDGDEIVLEATGRPNHTSPYWNPNNASGLYVPPDPEFTDEDQMSPGFIEEYNNLFTLRIPVDPVKAASSSSTSLGAIGIAVSGAPIFNDQEGPNRDLDLGVISGFDRSGAHTGPSTYHYHLEPRAFSIDDSELIGVIGDGFLIYGRRCFSTGNYPTDLDVSGGHTSATQHSDGDVVYHYHIINEFYLGEYYLLFPENYQGTPNSVGG